MTRSLYELPLITSSIKAIFLSRGTPITWRSIPLLYVMNSNTEIFNELLLNTVPFRLPLFLKTQIISEMIHLIWACKCYKPHVRASWGDGLRWSLVKSLISERHVLQIKQYWCSIHYSLSYFPSSIVNIRFGTTAIVMP